MFVSSILLDGIFSLSFLLSSFSFFLPSLCLSSSSSSPSLFLSTLSLLMHRGNITSQTHTHPHTHTQTFSHSLTLPTHKHTHTYLCHLSPYLDLEAPQITCPSTVTGYTDTSLATGRTEWPLPNVTDNSGKYVAVDCTAVPGSTSFLLGSSQVTCVATDLSGNSASCSFIVIILDKEIPLITCPSDRTVDTLPGKAYGNTTWDYPTTSDNSGLPVTIVGSASPLSNKFEIGTTVVRYIATDAAGNVNSCTFTVTVQDKEAPEVTCPSDVYTTTLHGMNVGRAEWSTPTTWDNSGAPVQLTSNYNPGDLFAYPGGQIVEYTATDMYGNYATCTFTVHVAGG